MHGFVGFASPRRWEPGLTIGVSLACGLGLWCAIVALVRW